MAKTVGEAFWSNIRQRWQTSAEHAARDPLDTHGDLAVRDFALALWHGEHTRALHLVESGLDLTLSFHYLTPLGWSAAMGDGPTLTHILRVSQASALELSSTLKVAVSCDQPTTAQLLLRAGAEVHDQTSDSLLTAAEFGNQRMVALLLANGARVDSKNYFLGQTPLMQCARWAGIIQTYPSALYSQTLVYASAQIGFSGRPLESLVPLPDHLAVAVLLLDAGADLSAQDCNRLTALDYAGGRYSHSRGVVAFDDRVNPAMVSLLTSRSRPSGCYIATAVYGDYDAPEVRALRKYRDNKLAITRLGRGLISFYYACSPVLVRFLRNNQSVRRAARTALDFLISRLEQTGRMTADGK